MEVEVEVEEEGQPLLLGFDMIYVLLFVKTGKYVFIE